MTATATKPTNPVADVEAQRTCLEELQGRGVDKEKQVATRDQARREKVRGQLIRGQRIGDDDIGLAIEVQRDDIIPAAVQAVIDAKFGADSEVAKGTVEQIRAQLEPAAKDLESLADHLRVVRPLFRKLTGELQPLGRRLPNRVLSGHELRWAIVAAVNGAWHGLLDELVPPQVRHYGLAELVQRDVDSAMRGLKEEG